MRIVRTRYLKIWVPERWWLGYEIVRRDVPLMGRGPVNHLTLCLIPCVAILIEFGAIRNDISDWRAKRMGYSEYYSKKRWL